MVKIFHKEEEPLPEQDVLPLELIVHPRISGDSLKLTAYLIRECLHNPRLQFEKQMFGLTVGMKHRAIDNCISELMDLKVLSIYTEETSTVYELDYTALMEILDDDGSIQEDTN